MALDKITRITAVITFAIVLFNSMASSRPLHHMGIMKRQAGTAVMNDELIKQIFCITDKIYQDVSVSITLR